VRDDQPPFTSDPDLLHAFKLPLLVR